MKEEGSPSRCASAVGGGDRDRRTFDMLLMDIYEPDQMKVLLGQVVEVDQVPLNTSGMADYMWQAVDGHWCQVERKQWGEVLGDLDGVEEQLRRELKNADELGLLIEGVAEPTPYGIDVYKKAEDKPYYRMMHSYGNSLRPRSGFYGQVQAWLWSLDKAGVSVYQTSNLQATATTLIAHFKQGLKEEHTVLNRYVKSRVVLKDLNPNVHMFMAIPGVGEDRAKKLADWFGNLWALSNAEVADICRVDGIGPQLAAKILRSLGREDI